jgi:hypothetical protein
MPKGYLNILSQQGDLNFSSASERNNKDYLLMKCYRSKKIYCQTALKRVLHVDVIKYKSYRFHQNVDLVISIGRDLFIVAYLSVAFHGTLYGMFLKPCGKYSRIIKPVSIAVSCSHSNY